MSKYELQQQASERSGISYEDSQRALQLSPSIYDRIGIEGFQLLSRSFYNSVYADKESQWFLNIFASSTMEGAIDNQYRFLCQTFGGPPLYREKKGKYTRLVGRHANYNIGYAAASKWISHMDKALKNHALIRKDDEVLGVLSAYFRYTAYYIVLTKQYMRSDQLSGGTCMDTHSNW
jgi:truncated hemoglobin YjbI